MRRPTMFSQPWLNAVSMWAAPSIIQSMWIGQIVISPNTSATATIGPVQPENCIVQWNGENFATTSVDTGYAWSRLELTNATTLTAYRSLATAHNLTTFYTVIEFRPGVLKSVQRGTMNGNQNATATITTVDPAKALLFWMGHQWGNTFDWNPQQYQISLKLTDATTVTSYRFSNAGTAVVPFQVVEFY